MSIQSEITRISGNVSDSLDAVAAKGVTVPAGSNSDDLPSLIASIPQGDVNVQSDWSETDTTSDAYIKNKPTLGNIVSLSVVEVTT